MATVDYRRPHTSMGFASPGPDLVNSDVKIGENILGSGFKQHLENFYHKASPEDRQRCLELITSLEVGDKIKDQSQYLPQPDPGTFTYQAAGLPSNYPAKHRPRTAMANIGSNSDPLHAYTTTYKREYTVTDGAPANAQRPTTARHQLSHRLSNPLGSTMYDNEYTRKQSKTTAIRTGTASGNRRNNPHPPEAFMVWKIRKDQTQHSQKTYPDLTDDVMDRVMRGKLASTYQEDYLGIPQGYQVKDAFPETQDWKSKIPFTLDSSTRYTFQKPDLQPELKCNTFRYGCNKKKHMAAAGVVPTVSNRHMDLKTRTTYEREYNANNGPLVRNVRDLGRNLAPLKPQTPSSRAGSIKYSYTPKPCVPAATTCVDNSAY